MPIAKKRRGKRVTPELHKVFWRAYIFTDPNTHGEVTVRTPLQVLRAMELLLLSSFEVVGEFRESM